MLRHLTSKSALALAFVLLNTLAAVLVVGSYHAAVMRQIYLDRAQLLSGSLAAIASERLEAYVLMLSSVSRANERHGGSRAELWQHAWLVAEQLDIGIALLRDDGEAVEMLLDTRHSTPPLPNSGTSLVEAPEVLRALRAARATGRIQVSGVYRDPKTGGSSIGIFSPPVSAEAGSEQVAASVPVETFFTLLAGQKLPDGAAAALIDQQGAMIASSGANRGALPPWIMQSMGGRLSGTLYPPGKAKLGREAENYVFTKLDHGAGWALVVSLPPALEAPSFVLDPETVAAGLAVFLASLLVTWAAYGREFRAAWLDRKIDEATRSLLQGMPGALLQIEAGNGKPRLIVSHGVLSAHLPVEAAGDLDRIMAAAVDGARSPHLPVDIAVDHHTLRIFARLAPASGAAPPRIDAFVLDVTALKHAEAMAAASSRLAAVGEIYASIAHEISQPLNVISLAAENGQEFLREGDGARATSKFQAIVKQAGRARHMVDRLLVFARGGPSPEDLSPVDVEACLSGATELASPRLRQHAITVQLHIGTRALKVIAAPLELEHVFLNVLLNAIDAIAETPDGGERVIDVGINVEGNEAAIIIEDSGGGIAEAVLPRAAEPFVTTKPKGAGTGLGLSYVTGAMKAFGGRVSISNGKSGAVVQLYFKLAERSG